MSVYNYIVRNSRGESIKGTLDSDSRDSVASKLREMGYFIVNISEAKSDKKFTLTGKKISFSFFNRIKTRDLVIFTRQFSTLISSGMSLLESLVVLEKQTANVKFKEIISEIKIDVQSGHTLSEAMEKHRVFNDLFISLIRAGEAGGVLDRTMNDLADFLEQEDELAATIKSKTAYPKFVLAFSVVISFVMIVFLVPTFKGIYDELGAELPMITQIVMWIGDLFKKVYFYIILAVVAFGGKYLFGKFIRSNKGKHVMDKVKISMPKFGELFRKMALGRFSRHFGILLATGVPILNSLEIAKSVSGNIYIDEALEKIKISIREGESMSDPMAEMTIFPSMMVQMIGVGERTGTLDSISSKIADFYEKEVSNGVDMLVTILEPMMLLFVALFVGVILISMYLPMFNIYQAL